MLNNVAPTLLAKKSWNPMIEEARLWHPISLLFSFFLGLYLFTLGSVCADCLVFGGREGIIGEFVKTKKVCSLQLPLSTFTAFNVSACCLNISSRGQCHLPCLFDVETILVFVLFDANYSLLESKGESAAFSLLSFDLRVAFLSSICFFASNISDEKKSVILLILMSKIY